MALAIGRLNDEAVLHPIDRQHTTATVSTDTPTRAGLGQERVEHGPRAVGIRKKLAVLLFVQLHAKCLEECRGALGGKCAKHVANDARGTAPEITLGHDTVGDVAARAAADQDLCADLRRAIKAAHVQVRRRARCEYRGRQPGCASTDDQDLSTG